MKATSIQGTRPLRTRRSIALLSTLLLAAACGGDDPVAPGDLVGIVVTPANANVDIGQSRTLTAQGRDAQGRALTGLTFTWTSADSSVATVAGGLVTAVSGGTTQVTASSGGVTSNAVTIVVTGNTAQAASIAIDRTSVLLPANGASDQLRARLLDAQGAPTTGRVTWTSSAPDRVSVDSTGRVVARAVGSALIHAQVGTLRSAPSLVLVAVPQTGAVLVADSQVLAVGVPLAAPGDAGGLGIQYDATLRGLSPPAPGTIIIASETAPIAGRIVSTRPATGGFVATLSLVPLPQVFRDYDIALSLDLSAVPLELVVGSSRVDLQACKLEYSIVSPK